VVVVQAVRVAKAAHRAATIVAAVIVAAVVVTTSVVNARIAMQ
jgi:hypothetical protein